MTGTCRNVRSGRGLLLAVAVVVFAFQARGQSQSGRSGDGNLTYARGQSVMPVYQGWTENADGSFNMHFSYINQNWEEEVDLPVGPNNNVTPAPFGPDAGQPTHFLPRQNRWQFTVRVPKDWGSSKEVIWTLTSHGQTNRAYGVLQPGYTMDEFLMQFEFGGQAVRGRKPPVIKVEGEKQRTVKVGESSPLIAVATDPGAEEAGRGRGRAAPAGGDGDAAPAAAAPAGGAQAGGGGRGRAGRGLNEVGPGSVGGDFIRSTAAGLRVAWFVYRGDGRVKFDPPMAFKVWEDQRGGSPWAPGWQAPPVPPGNKWVYNVTFQDPGTYVLRCLVHTGSTFAYENVTFNVTS